MASSKLIDLSTSQWRPLVVPQVFTGERDSSRSPSKEFQKNKNTSLSSKYSYYKGKDDISP